MFLLLLLLPCVRVQTLSTRFVLWNFIKWLEPNANISVLKLHSVSAQLVDRKQLPRSKRGEKIESFYRILRFCAILWFLVFLQLYAFVFVKFYLPPKHLINHLYFRIQILKILFVSKRGQNKSIQKWSLQLAWRFCSVLSAWHLHKNTLPNTTMWILRQCWATIGYSPIT